MSVDKKINYEIQGGVKNYRPSEMVTVPKIAKSSPDLISGTSSNGDILTEPCIKFLPFLPNLGLLPRALLNRS